MSREDEFDRESFLVAFGKHLARLRASKAYSQDRLALEAGFARGTMSKIESGKVEAKITTLVRIAETLDIPLRKLVDIPERR